MPLLNSVSNQNLRLHLRRISAACTHVWAGCDDMEAQRRRCRAAISRGEAHQDTRGDRWASRCGASFDRPYDL